MKEIVTVQVGGFANFVGSHVWNFQDEILGLVEEAHWDPEIQIVGFNSDVLFKVGETRQGEPTYTPRLLSIDCRGSSGAVSLSGSLYGQPPSADNSSIAAWQGSAVTFRSERTEKNKFLQSLDDEEKEWRNPGGSSKSPGGTVSADGRGDSQDDVQMLENDEKERGLVQSLEDGVHYWTDFLKCHLHPSSIFQIQGLWDGVTPFDHYGCARELISGEERAEEIRDKVRLFVEECDQMQGFQFMVDDSTGFSSIAADVLDDVVDEYGKTPILLFAVRPPDSPASQGPTLTRRLHDAVSLARLASLAHVHVPLGLPQISRSSFSEHLLVQDDKPFHSSAVYAAVVNAITLPYRMDLSGPVSPLQADAAGVGGMDMGTSLRVVSCHRTRSVALLEAAFPAPSLPDSPSISRPYEVAKLSSLTPHTEKPTAASQVGEMIVVQGARLAGSQGPATTVQVQNCLGPTRVRGMPAFSSHVAISPCPLAIPLPFPSIFSPYVGKYGDILSTPVVPSGTGRSGLDVTSSPVAARMSTSDAILPYVLNRDGAMRQLGLARGGAGPQLLDDWGFSREEAQELSESLSAMLEGAATRTDVGSDSSDDE